MIDNVNVTVLPLVKANRIGHTFAVSFHTDNTSDLEFHWYEKANKEYEIGNPTNTEPVYNEVDKWADMYEWAGSYSSVFKELIDEGVEGDRTICCNDLPYISNTPDNKRKLEFFIIIKDQENAWLITATQELEIAADGTVTTQEFVHQIIKDPVNLKPSDEDNDYYQVITY